MAFIAYAKKTVKGINSHQFNEMVGLLFLWLWGLVLCFEGFFVCVFCGFWFFFYVIQYISGLQVLLIH